MADPVATHEETDERLSVRLDERHLAMLDDAVERGIVPNRSAAIRQAIVATWDPPDVGVGVGVNQENRS